MWYFKNNSIYTIEFCFVRFNWKFKRKLKLNCLRRSNYENLKSSFISILIIYHMLNLQFKTGALVEFNNKTRQNMTLIYITGFSLDVIRLFHANIILVLGPSTSCSIITGIYIVTRNGKALCFLWLWYLEENTSLRNAGFSILITLFKFFSA